MSFKSNPFDRLSHLDPESRLNQFRKRFDDFSQNANQMFAEPNLANRWSAMNQRTEEPEEGIPIRVVHEKSDHKTASEPNDKNCDSMSSFGSSQSHRSSDTSHSSGSVFQSNQSTHSSDSSSSQPRVHHIPITVEPRDGSSSSGYTSEPNATTQPLSRSSSHSSAHSVGSADRNRNRSRTESPAPVSTAEASHEEKPRFRQIPIKVDVNGQRSASPLNQSPSTQSKSKSKSGPFVTRIPVGKQPNESHDNGPDIKSGDSEDKPVRKGDPMQEIDKILADLKSFENEVNHFEGTVDDKKYRYLDEMLTRCMIKLDTIETNGNEDIRKARKAAVLAVNQCIGLLEQKVLNVKNDGQQSQETDQPMQVSTPEQIPPQNASEEPLDGNDSQNSTEAEAKTSQETCDANQSMSNATNDSHRKETAV